MLYKGNVSFDWDGKKEEEKKKKKIITFPLSRVEKLVLILWSCSDTDMQVRLCNRSRRRQSVPKEMTSRRKW